MAKRIALVTGGSRGIGKSIVEYLLTEGLEVIFCGRADHAEIIGAYYIQCDISNPEDRTKMLDEISLQFGTLDVLVNNAGVAPLQRADILEASEESFDRLIDINLKGPYFLTQQVAKRMLENSKPNRYIVNIGSCSAEVASVSRGEYCISKAGIGMATKLWAVRLAEHNIPVYEVRPGVIKTDMTEAVTAKYDKLIAEGLTLQPRWGVPEDIAKAVASLVRGDFPYSTGQVINVDGGMQVERL